jgi:hypothetical protein
MKQFLKMCNVYRRPEGYFLFGLLNTPYGGIAVPPASQLPLAANAAELAKTVRKIFDELPDRITDVELAKAGKAYDEHLKEIGFPKPNAFPKKAFLVTVAFDREQHEVIPYHRNERGAFLPVKTVKLASDLDDENLGRAILEGFIEWA